MYIFIKYINHQTKRCVCNCVYWVKINHFKIETNGQRFFPLTPPPHLGSRILSEGFLYCKLAYLFQKVCSFTRGGGGICVQTNTHSKKQFAL